MAQDEVGQRALVDEALKKGALVWLHLPLSGESGEYDDRGHARWYAWTDGRLYLLTGGEEQPDPGLPVGGRVRLVVRSKDTKHRLLTFTADVTLLRASDDDWSTATDELVKARLNLAAAEDAPRRWAQPGYTVFRLTPDLPLPAVIEGEREASHRAPPPPTNAITAGEPPWVLHRRQRRARPLS